MRSESTNFSCLNLRELKKIICGFSMVTLFSKEECPPAWPQEAYRPPRSKYLLCCPGWRRGTPVLSGLEGGTPVLSWLEGTPVLSWPGEGYPSPVLTGGGGNPGLGYPWPELGYLPHGTGVPPSQDCGTPQKGPWTRDLEKNLELGYPPWVWTDTHVWKHYLPYPSDADSRNQLK